MYEEKTVLKSILRISIQKDFKGDLSDYQTYEFL